MRDFAEVILQTFTPTVFKLCTILTITVTFLFGNLYHQAIIAVLMLMVFDIILGMAAAIYEGQAITSRKFSRAVYKGIIYMISISAGYFLDTTLPFDVAQTTMIGFIASTEFISILENMGRMDMETPKKLLNQLRDFQSKK
jgi:toxin secretion/phage lysis holin